MQREHTGAADDGIVCRFQVSARGNLDPGPVFGKRDCAGAQYMSSSPCLWSSTVEVSTHCLEDGCSHFCVTQNFTHFSVSRDLTEEMLPLSMIEHQSSCGTAQANVPMARTFKQAFSISTSKVFSVFAATHELEKKEKNLES